MPGSHRSSYYDEESGSDSDEYNITGYVPMNSSKRQAPSRTSYTPSHHSPSHVSSAHSSHSRRPESHVSAHSSHSRRPESHVSAHSSHSRSHESHVSSRHSSRRRVSIDLPDKSDDSDDTVVPDDSASQFRSPKHNTKRYTPGKSTRDRDMDDLASRMSGSHISNRSHHSRSSDRADDREHKSSRGSQVSRSDEDAASVAWAAEQSQRAREFSGAGSSVSKSSRHHGSSTSRHSRSARDHSDDDSDDDRRSRRAPPSSYSTSKSHVSSSSRRGSTAAPPSYHSTREYEEHFEETPGRPMPTPARRHTVREFETHDGRGTVLRKRDDGRMEWNRPKNRPAKEEVVVPRWLQYFAT